MTRILPLAYILIAGCSSATTTRPAKTLPPAMVSPTRTATECAPLVDRVRAHPDSFMPSPPQMYSFPIPPFDGTPREMRGTMVIVRILVDELGGVVNDSTTITPALSAPSFDHEFRRRISRYQFHPAVLDGCAVPGRSVVQVTLADR